jgi:hypothetical protein
MTTIAAIEPLAHATPERAGFGMACGPIAGRQGSLARVRTSDAAVGHGEAWGPCRAAAAHPGTCPSCSLGPSPAVPAGPGLGAVLDAAALARFCLS